jgi:hypothetical protein
LKVYKERIDNAVHQAVKSLDGFSVNVQYATSNGVVYKNKSGNAPKNTVLQSPTVQVKTNANTVIIPKTPSEVPPPKVKEVTRTEDDKAITIMFNGKNKKGKIIIEKKVGYVDKGTYIKQNSTKSSEDGELFQLREYPENEPVMETNIREETEVFCIAQDDVRINYERNDSDRLVEAERLLNVHIAEFMNEPTYVLNEGQKQAILFAHEQPMTRTGMLNKLYILLNARFSRAEAKLLIESGITGTATINEKEIKID